MSVLATKAWASIHGALKSRGYVFAGRGRGVTRYGGVIQSGKTTVPVTLEIVDPLFTTMPKVCIEDETILKRIGAHLNADRSLCYAEAGVEEYDLYDAGGAALRALESAKTTLDQVLHSSAAADLQREFVAYWNPDTFLYTDLPPSFEGSAVCRVWKGVSGGPLIVTTQKKVSRWGGKTDETHPVFVLRTDRPLDTSKGPGPGRTLASLRAWLGNFVDDPVRIDKALSAPIADAGRLVLVAENGTVSASFAWPKVDSIAFAKAPPNRRARFIASNEGQMTMTRALADSVALPDLVNARLAEPSPLIGLAIAVVGAGAIGSRVCMELARCGAGQADKPMTVIDRELFMPANFGRHTLPVTAVRVAKASALADEIRRLHPDLKVTAITNDVFEVMRPLKDFDLIVDATGSNPVALRLNEEAAELRHGGDLFPPVLHAAIHGNGLAVQTILVADHKHACLKCLRPAHGVFKANPLKPGVQIKFEAASCGDGAHIRYAASAPMMAAALVVQAVMDWATDPADPGPRVRTRVLDPEQTNSLKDRSWGVEPGCPACDRSAVD